MESKTKRVPSLRFPKFEDDWTRAKIGDVFTLISGQHLNPEDYTTTEIDSTPYFTGPSDFTNDVKAITKWVLKHGKQAVYGDVLFTVKGSGVGALHLLRLPKVVIGRQLMSIRSSKASSLLLFHYLSTQKHYYQGLAYGNMIPGISRSDILETKLHLPSLFEQQKIAAFLNAVDDKIEQLTKKKALLEQYKKGVMQQIFNQEIRFKDENGRDYPAWEWKQLGRISTIKRGASPRPIADLKWFSDESNIGWVRISDVTKATKFLRKTQQYLSAEGISKSRLVKEGNLIMSICATIGKPIYTSFDVCIHDGFVVFDELTCNREYLYYYLDLIQLKWYKYGQPGSQVNLNSDIVAQEEVPQPSLKEQTKIAMFLSALDDKIKHIDQQIELTKQYKKGLLQQMFV